MEGLTIQKTPERWILKVLGTGGNDTYTYHRPECDTLILRRIAQFLEIAEE